MLSENADSRRQAPRSAWPQREPDHAGMAAVKFPAFPPGLDQGRSTAVGRIYAVVEGAVWTARGHFFLPKEWSILAFGDFFRLTDIGNRWDGWMLA